MRSAAALDVHSDAFGVGQNVFFDADRHPCERVVAQQKVAELGGERFDQFAWACGGEFLDLDGDRVVINRARDLIGETVETLAWSQSRGDEQNLRCRAFVIGHADVGMDLESADFDFVRHGREG